MCLLEFCLVLAYARYRWHYSWLTVTDLGQFPRHVVRISIFHSEIAKESVFSSRPVRLQAVCGRKEWKWRWATMISNPTKLAHDSGKGASEREKVERKSNNETDERLRACSYS